MTRFHQLVIWSTSTSVGVAVNMYKNESMSLQRESRSDWRGSRSGDFAKHPAGSAPMYLHSAAFR